MFFSSSPHGAMKFVLLPHLLLVTAGRCLDLEVIIFMIERSSQQRQRRCWRLTLFALLGTQMIAALDYLSLFFSNFFCTLLHFFLWYIHLEVIQEAFYFTFSTSLIRQICLEPVLYLFNHECRSSTPHTDDGWEPKRSWLEFIEISSEYTQQHWDHIHRRREMGNSSTFFRLLFFILSSSLYSSLIFIFIFFFLSI